MAELQNPMVMAAAMEESGTSSLTLWPVAAGLVAAGLASGIVSSSLQRGTLPVVALPFLAAALLFMSAAVWGVVLRLTYRRVLHGKEKIATSVLRAACLTALWLPSWMLFVTNSSPLGIAAAALGLACMGMLLKRCMLDESSEIIYAPPLQPGTPFLFPDGLLVRQLLPSLWLVLLFDCAVALATAGWFFLASAATAVFAGVLAWRATLSRMAGMPPQRILSGFGQSAVVTTAFAFTIVALVPYLKAGILGFNPTIIKKAPPAGGAEASGDLSTKGYIGIILLPLKDQQKRIVAPVRRDYVPHFGVKISDPLEIPFDGQYWYFKWPDKRPRPNARVVRGSSTKTQVSSSTRTPLLMEAHQKLIDPMDLGCCSAINLVVENADQLNGAISLELWVRKLPDSKLLPKQRSEFPPPQNAPHYLGTAVIPSSALPIGDRPNASGKTVEETLNFSIPAGMSGTLFDEISVVVKTAPERARMGAKVAIKKFVLEP